MAVPAGIWNVTIAFNFNSERAVEDDFNWLRDYVNFLTQ